MDKWDHRFYTEAQAKAAWSKDPYTRVGAVVVRGRKIAGTGYNGFPAGVRDDPARYAAHSVRDRLVIHAEQNAIMDAGRDCEGATIYITKFPCTRKGCAQAIIQSGIARVVCPTESNLEHAEDVQWALTLFEEAGVKIDLITPENN